MITEIDAPVLAEAFPAEHRSAAFVAGVATARLLAPGQSTERFAVLVESQSVLIPARLHFASDRLTLTEADGGWRFARALQTRSSDGFLRQRAARDLLVGMPNWAAPFIVSLIGGYVVEILEDVAAAVTPELEQTLGAFIADNAVFWGTTKRRVTSYWNAYYRHSSIRYGQGPAQRDEYIGFQLVDRLEAAALGHLRSAKE